VHKALERRSERPKSLREALSGKLTAREREGLVTSFDLVGDIAVVEVPMELRAKEKLIASALMAAHRNVKVVARKTGGTSGEFRIRPVEVIAGEKRTRALYREGGCVFELDLNKTYFSPRLGTERGRLCALVRPGEKVLVPFAGVGPFAIRLGKAEESADVVGVELNPDACGFFRANVARNNCKNVRIVEGDVAALLPGKYAGWADRLAMPLPKDAKAFLANAMPCLKKGGMLHYYSFGSIEAPFEEAEKDVLEAAAKLGRKARVVFRRTVRPYSKDTEQVAVDAEIL
jgi:tRNA (guanine37-N1)-methyltransferase